MAVKRKTKCNNQEAVNLLKKIQEHPDFIYAPRYKNSLMNFLKNNPQGTEDFATIAKMLLLTEEQVRELYRSAIQKIQMSLHQKK